MFSRFPIDFVNNPFLHSSYIVYFLIVLALSLMESPICLLTLHTVCCLFYCTRSLRVLLFFCRFLSFSPVQFPDCFLCVLQKTFSLFLFVFSFSCVYLFTVSFLSFFTFSCFSSVRPVFVYLNMVSF